MIDLVGPAQVVQVGPQPVEVGFAFVTQGIRDPRRFVRDRSAGLLLAVQQPKRVLLVAARAVGADPVQAVRVPGPKLFHVSRTAHRASRAVHLEGQVLDADRFVDLPGDLHDLEIDGRVLAAQHFHVDLVELAVPARLGTLVPEGRADGVEPQGLGPAVQLALGVGTADPRSELGAQGHALLVAVEEGVHLLLDDVGGFADAPLEEAGLLEDRHVDLLVAEEFADPARGLGHVAPVGLVLGEDVVGASRCPVIHNASCTGC